MTLLDWCSTVAACSSSANVSQSLFVKDFNVIYMVSRHMYLDNAVRGPLINSVALSQANV